ncbi:hypothetical protein [Rhodobacter sp. TJ_12]|uniref:hypothetical protein n=1 Tax=Rhodobacter sp. TJ_12 TaxID=2029399 RepID=UPI001CBDAB76|nr:hypothetical protein [Rhodobacter sp. TJ_12]
MRRSLPFVFSLLIGTVASPGFAKDAACEVTLGGARIDGACDFRPRGGGSFDVTMKDGRSFEGAPSLSLDVLRKGSGEIRNGSRSLGAANRSDSDPACWAGDDVTLCVRALGEGNSQTSTSMGRFSHPTDLPKVLLGRCHMGGCWWARVEDIEVMGEGSALIPGKRIRVRRSSLSLEAGNDEGYERIEAEATADNPGWTKTRYEQFFCSMERPAYLRDDEVWEVLTPTSVFGFNEGITNIYLSLCHADDYSGDTGAASELGYEDRGIGSEQYGSFTQLTSP